MFDWFLDLASWAQGLILVVAFVIFGSGGLLLTRSWVRQRFGDDPDHNERVTFLIEVVGVFYALLVGLVAVGAYDHYIEVKSLVTLEASQLTTVYRGAQAFPNSRRCRLQSQIRNYTEHTIEKVWPAQENGVILGDRGRLDAVFESLMFYEPQNTQEGNAQSVTLDALNEYNNLRRQRQAEVETGLLPVLYVVLFIGAVVAIATSWGFSGVRFANHLALTGVLSFSIGLFLFLILALDYPLKKSNPIEPEAWTVALEEGMDVPLHGEKQVDTYFGVSTAEQVPGCLLKAVDYVSFAGSEQLPE
ncbi:MAG: DUF4239 domain-containing protein [Actinomycetota bacterium]|nr:DUF4239 domain-containing protein [Actinomycetota bacterium]